MKVKELRDKLDTIVDDGLGNHRVYVYTDQDPSEKELHAVEARDVEPFKPFWSTVDGFIIT